MPHFVVSYENIYIFTVYDHVSSSELRTEPEYKDS
jgi:hypothetical protein